MAQNRSRLALDLDEIERQLRQPRPAEPAKNDPLAELARIVGQDDPFRSILSQDQAPGLRQAAASSPRAAPPFAPLDPAEWDETPARHVPQGFAPMAAHAYETDDPTYPEAVRDLRSIERSRSRKGLVTVGLVLGVGALGIAGALLLRGEASLTANGEPPMITADREPLKVKPENPGGVDIPDQNKQIYERGAQDSQTKVVNREEQPVDVQQVARMLPAAPAAAPANPAAIVPPAPAILPRQEPVSASAALGEPRRVRTVTVRPDGTIIGPSQASASPSVPPQVVAAAGQPVADAPSAPRAEPRASATPTTPQAATPARATPAPAAARPQQEAAPLQASPSPVAAAPRLPQRTAALAPPAPSESAPETTSAAGGFSVQLAVGASENEARGLAQNLRQKFAGDLNGRAPLVRKAEVNGKTLYRVRVEPLSRDEANALCTRLRSSGGQCFIARN
jgi:hypothetical protein